MSSEITNEQQIPSVEVADTESQDFGKQRRPKRTGGSRPNSREKDKEAGSEFIEKLVHVNRVTKVVKGGRRFAFAVLVVVGDGKGRVGVGTGKSREVPSAITKATEFAKRSMVHIPMREGRTLHHDVVGHFGASRVVMRTVDAGAGVIAGGAMRAVFEAMGIKDVVAKSTGSSNPYNLVYATLAGLESILPPRVVAARRNKKIGELVARRAGSNVETVNSEVEA